ncbi:hypothetical protein [Sutcliffiella halmapala]|uniref:hypothetical protein n=1 Tax=Sutcliffiella halmapala TaxID=79882 RepID=UPI000994C68F|nr:hypothetical protein [Sutcliffiella halmapala]
MLSFGDLIFQSITILILLVPILFLILIIIFIVRAFRRMEARAEERLKLDRENIAFQQVQIKANNELNERLSNIEKLLKEVD